MKKVTIEKVKDPIKPQRERSLAFVKPNIAQEWDYKANYPLTPWDISYGTTFEAYFICPNKHSYKIRINNRTSSNQSGCPFCCSNGGKVSDTNSFASKHPELIEEWHFTKNGGLSPQSVRFASLKEVWWLCKKCHNEWEATIEQRHAGHQKCPKCNKLAYLYPNISKEWHPTKNKKLTPWDVNYGSGRKVWWLCKNGHEWQSTVTHRTTGTGCPYCCKVVLKGHIVCASMVEAYYYLKFKKEKGAFIHDKKYHKKLGKSRYDFHFPSTNTYVEVTGYFKRFLGWNRYYKSILRKKKFVETELMAKFKFIQKKLNGRESDMVRGEME